MYDPKWYIGRKTNGRTEYLGKDGWVENLADGMTFPSEPETVDEAAKRGYRVKSVHNVTDNTEQHNTIGQVVNVEE